ncbi:transposable element Tcb1 transposase [Trichonephila clavipes]|nr:transposable element Tcb1 transposase [Trichonephila clavipes]
MTRRLNSISKEDFLQCFRDMYSSLQWCIVVGGDYFVKDSKSHKQKSQGVRSSERGSQAVGKDRVIVETMLLAASLMESRNYIGQLHLTISLPINRTGGRSRKISISAERRGRADRTTNQEIKRHLDAFTRGRIIGKLEEGRSVTSVAAEFGIPHSIVSRLWRQFQTTGTATQEFSSGRPRGTTPADDRYIVLQARRNRWQTAGEIVRHTTQATGRPISRFTMARRLHGGGLFTRRPIRCVPLTPAHRNWRRRSLILLAGNSRNHPSNFIDLRRSFVVNGTLYCNEILLPYVRLF